MKLCELEQIALNGDMVMAHAKYLAKLLQIHRCARPQFGWPWLRHLQSRYGIRWCRAFGEGGLVDLEAANPRIEELRQATCLYRPCHIYNMDESAFFYNNVPRGSLCFNAAPSLKQNKARVTMAHCANADDSHKLPVLFLGKAKNPRWLSEKPENVQYSATERAWMTSAVFSKWLQDFDKSMRSIDRHILLLIDNASFHNIGYLQLSNIRLEWFPPNTTAKIQPMDQGIIYAVKRNVLHRKMRFALRRISTGLKNLCTVGLLHAMTWCEAEWAKVSPQTILNC